VKIGDKQKGRGSWQKASDVLKNKNNRESKGHERGGKQALVKERMVTATGRVLKKGRGGGLTIGLGGGISN